MKMMKRFIPVLSLLVWSCALSVQAESAVVSTAEGVSDALKVKRPTGGEYFGLYLLDKKVGWMFSDFTFVPGATDKVQSISELYFKVGVGAAGKVSERHSREVRVYEAKPGGRLLSMVLDQKGDGGEQHLEVTATAKGLTVMRKRPGQPTEVRTVAASKEVVEDSDQARVSLLRQENLEGFITDGEDLSNYKLTTTLGKTGERTLGGVKVKVSTATTLSEKEKIPVDLSITEDGAVIEVNFGGQMRAMAESESVAKRQDQVEVFGLTKVPLPQAPPPWARQVPGSMRLVMSGIPERFWRDTYRQKYKGLPDGKVEVRLSANAPKLEKKLRLPLKDPSGGPYLKSTLVVEADSPKIQAAVRKILAGEKDAYVAARKISSWVDKHMTKDYGASADRATDILKQMRGDCTEHSLLTVALLRAAGIPAKRVDGVVYLDQGDGPAFYWHEWVEAWVGEWTQLDPTFGQDVADATHFAVGEEGNAEIIPLIGQMKVLEVH